MENKMNEVAKILGLEPEEEFNIDDYGDFFSNFSKFKLSERGLFYWSNMDRRWCGPIDIPNKLLTGENKIIKLPKPILNEKEREYLSVVTKPFRDRKVVIKKYEYPQNECIQMSVEYYDKTGGQTVTLPIFKKGTMYKGLESNKCYTLEDLGL